MIATTAANPATLFAPIADELVECDRIIDEAIGGLGQPAILDHLRHYRGKRLRPALVLLAAKACGEIQPAHMTLAAVVEMIHTATLVHDDILDSADRRRHVRTVNAEWGNQTAVLLGDGLFTNAFFLASTVDVRACRWIGEATNAVCAGELKQVCERGNLRLTETDYYAIIDGKTAALVEVSTRIGAAYASENEDLEERFARYGNHLGLAFQIADDLLDYTGNEARVGKTLGTDAMQGKLTLPLIHCLSKLPARDAEALCETIECQTTDVKAAILAAFARTNSIPYAKYRADEHAAMARAELDGLPESEALRILRLLPSWATARSS